MLLTRCRPFGPRAKSLKSLPFNLRMAEADPRGNGSQPVEAPAARSYPLVPSYLQAQAEVAVMPRGLLSQ